MQLLQFGELQIFISVASLFWAVGIALTIAAVYYWRNTEFRKQRAAVRAYKHRKRNQPKAY